ncbi:condensin complex subunit 3 isoform X2 [Eupeodes corollae]|uniref:condensin complex subunit 3 isoform X2 n=1 Tax=Eupeodes corollae TaxID=290404 RepID=UPI0024907ECD|nr:condensin complex subunit 3 isoform X2 [Eupeodes corollae]
MKMPRKRKVPVPAIIEEEEKENESELAEVSRNSTATSVVQHGPMYSIMANVQLNETFHKKYIREMSLLYDKMDHDAFMFTFIKMVKSAMEGEETNEYAYTTLLFCAKFVASYDVDDTHPVLVDTCRWLLTTISQNPHIRFRLCQFVNMILNALGLEAALDDAICDGIMEYMLRRLRDINPNVRVQAILALQRLQNPDNPDDVVLRVYQFHLCSDPSPRVRQAVVTSMGRNYSTIPYILDRLWDIDEKVRRHTYLHMSGYPVKAYKVSQRLQLLEQGLNDRSEMVKKVVTSIMLPQWLESYNKNFILFVSALKLDASEAEVERFLKIAKVALFEIFKRQKTEDLVNCVPLEEDGEFHKCIPHDKLSIEVTLYWQCLIEHLSNTMDDELESIIPELSTFCSYVLKFCEVQKSATDKFMKMEFQYVLLSLLEILYLYDLGDEIGRENLKKLITTVLKTNDLEEKLVEVIVKCTENLITDQNSRLQFFVEIIEEITHTSSFKNDTLINDRILIDELLEKHSDKDLKLKLSSLKVKILDLEEQEMNFVEMKDYVQAQRITEEKNAYTEEYTNLLKPLLDKHSTDVSGESRGQTSSLSSCFQRTKKVTSETIIKSLQIAFYMVVSKNVRTLTPNVCKLYHEFIGRHIASNQIAIRDWALKCGTAYSMLYEALAKEIYEVLYAQFFKNHNIRIWKTSITCIFELLDRYGCSSFNVEERQNKSKRNGRQLYNTLEFLDADDDSSVWSSGQAVDIIFMMSHFLDTCDDVCIISAIVNGFCRLVLHDHIKNSEILEKLLLRYFNPSTDAEINQILGVFLENLIQRKKQDYLHPCLLPTVSQVIGAPYESPLHEIKPETVLRFVIDATRPEFCSPGANIHNKLALSFLQEMQNNIANKDLCKILSKELLTLEMVVQDDLTLKDQLKGIAEKLINCEFDSKTLKNVIDFKDLLDGKFNPPLMPTNPDGSDDDDKTDDEIGSGATTEKEFEKVTSNETASNRLLPVLEEDETIPSNSTIATEEISSAQIENNNSVDKEKTLENENSKETEKEKTTSENSKSQEKRKSNEGKKTTPEKKKSPEKKAAKSNRKQTRSAKQQAEKEKNAETSPQRPVPVSEPLPPPTPKQTVVELNATPQRAVPVAELIPPSTPAAVDISQSSMTTPANSIRAITTPTTFGRENSTGLRYLRKSMNSARQNTHPEDAPSPKIRIEARIDTVMSPQKPLTPVQVVRTTRQKLRALANPSNSPTEVEETSTRKREQSAKNKKKPTVTSTRKTPRRQPQKEKEPSPTTAATARDSDECEEIPPSPTSSTINEGTSEGRGSTARRFNRTLRFDNIKARKYPATPGSVKTRSNRNNTPNVSVTPMTPLEPTARSTRKRPISPNSPKSLIEGNETTTTAAQTTTTTSSSSSTDTPNNNTANNTNSIINKDPPNSSISNTTNSNTGNEKQQTPIRNKLRARNSNVSENPPVEQIRSTRRTQKKTNSPSSKENEPKSPSKSVSSESSSDAYSTSSSESDDEEELNTPKILSNKRRSNLNSKQSVAKSMTNKNLSLVRAGGTTISASASRINTRNSARKNRQNNMIMTRKRLSLENVHSPKSRPPLFASPKTKSNKKPSGAVTQPKAVASKIPVNIALRSNRSNTSINKPTTLASSESVPSMSASNTESGTDSEEKSSDNGGGGAKRQSQYKQIVQQLRNSSSSAAAMAAIQRPRTLSRIARSTTRTIAAKTMLRKRNI